MSEVKFNFHKNKTEIEKLADGDEQPVAQETGEPENNNNDKSKEESNKPDERTSKKSFLVIGLIVAFLICLSIFTFFAYDAYDVEVIIPNNSVFNLENNESIITEPDLQEDKLDNQNDNEYRFIVSLNESFDRVKVYKFLDLECPFCKDLDLEISSLKLKYEDVIDFEYVHLPLTQIHPNALRLSQTYICLEEQNQHLVFRNEVYEKQDELDDDVIDSILSELVFEREEFDTCMESDFLEDEMNQDAKLAAEYNIGATPTLVINGTIVDNTLESIENAINDALSEAGIETREVSQKEYDELFARLAIQEKLDQNEQLTINEVATIDPNVPVVVLTSQECVFCQEESTIKLLKENYFPNMKIEILDASDRVAKSMIDVHEITSLPAFIFDESIENTYNFNQISNVLEKKNFTYLLDPLTHKSGMILGNIITQDFSYTKGNENAGVVVQNYFNYECTHCADFYNNVESVIFEDYKDRVKWVDQIYISNKFVSSSILAGMTQCYLEATGNHTPIQEELFLFESDILQLAERANRKILKNESDAISDLEENLLGLVKGLLRRTNVDQDEFKSCVDSAKVINLEEFRANHQRQGIRVVPTIVINGQILEGAPDEAGMRQLLDQFLDGSIYTGGVDFSN